jgi:hypothetical protein
MEVTPAPQKEDCYIAVDIEKVSCTLYGNIVAVGFAVKLGSLTDGNIHSSLLKSFYIQDNRDGKAALNCWEPDQVAEEKRCLTEFWSKYPGLLERYTQSKDSMGPVDAAIEITTFVNELYNEYNVKGWFSDNPAFDLGHLDHWLFSLGARLFPLRHSPQGKYVSVQDPSEQYRGLLDYEKKAVDEMSKVPSIGDFKPHEPSYDAECILRQAMAIERLLTTGLRQHLMVSRMLAQDSKLF